MKYDPRIHHRRSIRLKGYDYTQPGAYFVTMVTRGRECLFGEVADSEMRSNDWGRIVAACWNSISGYFPDAGLDAFVVMSNHVHGIIVIGGDDSVGVKHSRSLTDASPLPNGTQSGSLAAIVQNFKSVSTRKINAMRGMAGVPVWQRNYYEHIVRNAADLHRIREYIANNPRGWGQDSDNPDHS
jgi:REP element-mobilizing transposase RayT